MLADEAKGPIWQRKMAEPIMEGPWGGVEDVAPGGLPRSADGVLKLAKGHGWGFGPITLVMRLNHPAPGVPPFFVQWTYSLAKEGWVFEQCKNKDGNELTYPQLRAFLALGEEFMEGVDDGQAG